MQILITGFERFAELQFNPSELIVRWLSDQNNPQLITEILPVTFQDAGVYIRTLLHRYNPDAVLMLGVASRRDAINLERVALNVNDSAKPDNAGVQLLGDEIVSEGPVGYWSTLPLDRMQCVLQKANIRVRISNHAGAYVCNHVFYVAQHELAMMGKKIPCGFVHVPLIANESPGLPLDTLIQAVELCIQVLLEEETA